MNEKMMLESTLLKYDDYDFNENDSLYGDKEIEVIYNTYTGEFEMIIQ